MSYPSDSSRRSLPALSHATVALELMRLHVQSLFVHDQDSRLVQVNETQAGPAPRFFLGRTPAGCIWRFRNDVPPRVAEEIQRICEAEPPVESEDDHMPRGREAY